MLVDWVLGPGFWNDTVARSPTYQYEVLKPASDHRDQQLEYLKSTTEIQNPLIGNAQKPYRMIYR
jgi:hypothetical protein